MNYLEIYPVLKKVEWFDLVRPGRLRVVFEILLPLPFLLISLFSIHNGWITMAFAGAFFFFLAGLRLSHNAQHYIVGCKRKSCEWVMYGLSILMMNSMHAVQVTHLRHHKHCLDEYDVEGYFAKLPFWQAILYGPLFTVYMHTNAWKLGSSYQRKWIAVELISELIALTVALLSGVLFLEVFVLLMLLANCLTGFFCVWLVHYGCDGLDKISRTMRSPWINRITMNMLLHVEHHLFPQVPTYNLGKLARRIDVISDQFQRNQVI